MTDIDRYRFFNTMHPQLGNAKKRLNGFGQKMSEMHLIIFDYKVILLCLVALFLFGSVVLFKMHGSSMAWWNIQFPDERGKNLGLLIGKAKSIRGDEFRTYTPYILSQAQLGFPTVNESIGGGKAPLFANTPVAHYTTFFRTQLWGFFVLDLERGFSVFWAF
jgi:hypothetical protein